MQDSVVAYGIAMSMMPRNAQMSEYEPTGKRKRGMPFWGVPAYLLVKYSIEDGQIDLY